jgi:hypothetical protein
MSSGNRSASGFRSTAVFVSAARSLSTMSMTRARRHIPLQRVASASAEPTSRTDRGVLIALVASSSS